MDPRDIQARYGNWYQGFNESRMEFSLVVHEDDGGEKEICVPARYEVCGLCYGKGSHVNPSIDHNGITASEMHELGEDFEEEYFGGVYDVSCYRCKGRRVAPVVNWDSVNEETKKVVESAIEDHNGHVFESISELRYLGEY